MKLAVNLGIIFLLTALMVNAAGLGVAPATLSFENALKGATTEKQLTIQNPEDKAIFVSIEIDGELKEWIELYPAGKIEVPAKGSAKITVKLTPPVEKENEEYESEVHVRAVGTADVKGSGMGLMPGVNTDIVATITDEKIIGGKVDRILTKDETYGDPVKFNIGFQNTGNIPLGPDIKIEIEKRGSGIVGIITETMDKIKPGASENYVIEWPTDGEESNVYYRAVVAVSLAGEIIEKKENIGFRVLEPVSKVPAKQAEEPRIADKSGSPIIGMGVTAVIIAIGIIMFALGKKKKI